MKSDINTLRAELLALLDAGDLDTLIATNRQLIATAERRPPDEPPLKESGPMTLLAETVARCLAALPAGAPEDLKAQLWINRANALRLAGPGHDAEAEEAFAHALELDDSKGWWWFDLGLLHKWRGRFERGLDCNLKARSRVGEEKPILWNTAICATALGQGDLAAGIWRDLGIPVTLNEKSGMPFVDGLPPVQVRVLSRSSGHAIGSPLPEGATGFEILWVAPLSPCHGVVQSPSMRDAPIDYGDVILWDGAPISVEQGPGGPIPRFPLLEILRRGDERRFRFVSLQQESGDTEALAKALPEGCRIFVLHEKVEMVCPTCASGQAMVKHEHQPPEEHRIAHGKMIVPAHVDLASLRSAFEGAIGKGGKVMMALPELYETLGETKRAGQEHQTWRGIERTAMKRGLSGKP